MKILLINYRYFLSGGPEKYMFSIKSLLESHGHEVIPFSVHSKKNAATEYEKYFADPVGGEDATYYEDYKKTPKTVLQMIDRQFYSLSVKKKLEQLISDTNPDVCYLLHHYNKLSPSVISACKKNNIPIVMRLSDFFLVCPDALLIRGGKICEECIEHSLLLGVIHKCVKNSFPISAIKAAAMTFHRLIRIYDKVNYIVAPSIFTIDKIKMKFANFKFVQLPTFIVPTEKYNPQIGKYILSVGRLEEEKGVLTLIKSVEGSEYRLIIVGKSSTDYGKKIQDYISKKGITNVKLLGPKYGNELKRIYRNAHCFVMPSEWYENMPNVVLEAMLYSRPVIASNLGSLKEIVKNNTNGLMFKPGDSQDLRNKIDLLFKDQRLAKKLGKNAYLDAISKYSPENHYNILIGVFNKAIKEEKSKWKH
jgi:glycosyltransferase involved in cell wall biosynthesis